MLQLGTLSGMLNKRFCGNGTTSLILHAIGFNYEVKFF